VQYQTDRDAKKAIIYKRINNATNISYDWRGRSQYAISSTAGMLALQRQTFVGLGFQLGYERVFEHEFGATRNAVRRARFSVRIRNARLSLRLSTVLSKQPQTRKSSPTSASITQPGKWITTSEPDLIFRALAGRLC
jgi:hypothetical protein